MASDVRGKWVLDAFVDVARPGGVAAAGVGLVFVALALLPADLPWRASAVVAALGVALLAGGGAMHRVEAWLVERAAAVGRYHPYGL
jgi:hypothetical protein